MVAIAMRYMLDTNVCIYAIKNRPPEVLAALREHESAGIGISSISVAELYFGVRKSGAVRNLLALKHFLEPLEVADFDIAAAKCMARFVVSWKVWVHLLTRWMPKLPRTLFLLA